MFSGINVSHSALKGNLPINGVLVVAYSGDVLLTAELVKVNGIMQDVSLEPFCVYITSNHQGDDICTQFSVAAVISNTQSWLGQTGRAIKPREGLPQLWSYQINLDRIYLKPINLPGNK